MNMSQYISTSQIFEPELISFTSVISNMNGAVETGASAVKKINNVKIGIIRSVFMKKPLVDDRKEC
jgi:hypothetical protein